MKKNLTLLAAFLLVINGAGAIYGGWNLISHPDGSGFGIPLYILKYSPFDDFLIPGIILFVMNGVLSFVVLAMLIKKKRKYPWYVIGEGAILFGWIFIQVIMIRAVGVLHIIFGSIGILLIICGWKLKNISYVSKLK